MSVLNSKLAFVYNRLAPRRLGEPPLSRLVAGNEACSCTKRTSMLLPLPSLWLQETAPPATNDGVHHSAVSVLPTSGPVGRANAWRTGDRGIESRFGVCLFVGWLLNVPATSYSVSQGRIWSDNFTCCHTEIEAADQTFYLTQSLYTDTGPTSPSTDPITLGAWQGSHWNANV